MNRRSTSSPDDSDAQRSVRLDPRTSAFGLAGKDYDARLTPGFADELLTRLDRLVRSGATDVEVVGVLDHAIDSELRKRHAELDGVHATRDGEIDALITLADKDLRHAARAFKSARKALRDARARLGAQRELLDARDPRHASLHA
jgi:hypothetical protein